MGKSENSDVNPNPTNPVHCYIPLNHWFTPVQSLKVNPKTVFSCTFFCHFSFTPFYRRKGAAPQPCRGGRVRYRKKTFLDLSFHRKMLPEFKVTFASLALNFFTRENLVQLCTNEIITKTWLMNWIDKG